jgi:hypothetical protein
MKKALLTMGLVLVAMCAWAQEDRTSLITNPSFEDGFNGWTQEGLQTQTNSDFPKKEGGMYVEKWTSSGNAVGNASVKQTLKNLPGGVYRLTAAAMNYSQDNKTKKNTGAYIFAGKEKETVYTPDDYSLTFTHVLGDVEIGFVAQGATGNWIATDNFRLAFVEKVDPALVVEALQGVISQAEALQASPMSKAAAEGLKKALETAKGISSASTEDEIQSATEALTDAMADAQASISVYQALKDQIAQAEEAYDESKEGASELKAELDKAQALIDSDSSTAEEMEAETTALNKAILAFHLANATSGTGIAPKVTKTDHYVATGATQALMRATMTGNNLIEKGVCWSTEHEPTVLDNRTTDAFKLSGDIFHITGLKPATVYYLRPYAMNKTYKVAYGDEVKIVTFPKGTATWSWDEGAPTAEANDRCRKAMEETIEYFNEWTGIKGFHLSGHYGAQTPTADCSYGGSMRIGPVASYQAIGTVLHETGHGVGVGTSDRWWDTNVHNWEWLGRAANEAYQFLENKEGNDEYVFVGDSQHGWGQNSTYDWLVNGAHKDTHQELQYIGGMCIMRGFFIDGLCPTWDDENGIAGYTYNFDDAKKYYLMNKATDRGLGEALLYQRTANAVAWQPNMTDETVNDSAAWYLEYNSNNGFYSFKNVATGKYLTHAAGGSQVALKSADKASTTEQFQLMPDRTDVTIKQGFKKVTTHGYWFTWEDGSTYTSKAMGANTFGKLTGYGNVNQVAFDYSDKATSQQWIIISEDEIGKYQDIAKASGIEAPKEGQVGKVAERIFTPDGVELKTLQKGINVIKYNDGKTKKVFVK